MLEFDRFEALSFDCYGTLIDWESGMIAALEPLLLAHGVDLDNQTILSRFAEFEAELEQGGYQKYRQVLETVVQKFGRQFGFEPSLSEQQALPESIQDWMPFPDTVDALKVLQNRFKLIILSNIDRDLFADSAKHLQVEFDHIITAEQAGSYKPSLNNFKVMLQEIKRPAEKILHVAASIYHDVIPASSLGFSTVWVDRRHGQAGSGAVLAAKGQPDLIVPDLKTLASQIAC